MSDLDVVVKGKFLKGLKAILYRKNARLLSEIRLRSFLSSSEGGGSLLAGGLLAGLPLEEEVTVEANIGLLVEELLEDEDATSNLGMYFSPGFNSDNEVCNRNI